MDHYSTFAAGGFPEVGNPIQDILLAWKHVWSKEQPPKYMCMMEVQSGKILVIPLEERKLIIFSPFDYQALRSLVIEDMEKPPHKCGWYCFHQEALQYITEAYDAYNRAQDPPRGEDGSGDD